MKAIRTPNQPRQEDPKVERALQDYKQTIDRVASTPGAQMVVIGGVALEDGVDTPVPHKLGKAPAAAWVSLVRGAVSGGMVEEVRTSGAYDRARYVTLKATGYGATVTVDLIVVP